MQFLMGLNETFTQVRGQILLMDPMPNIDRVFSLIRQEEWQRSIGQLSVPMCNLLLYFATLNQLNLHLPNKVFRKETNLHAHIVD
jgi:hypothetical protein